MHRALESFSECHLKSQTQVLTKVGNDLSGYFTPGEFSSDSTPRVSNIISKFSKLTDLLIDIDVYRSISPLKFEEEKDKPRRNTMHSRSDWYEEEMRNVDQVNEELMVIYYSTSLIFINKNQDALKSVSRYMKKSNISQISLANLYKIHAFLLMISIDYSNSLLSLMSFKSGLKLFQSLRVLKGVAICQLGILKICHDRFLELTNELNQKEAFDLISQCFSMSSNAIQLFEEIDFLEGKKQ